jgi:hypothetical protein
LVSFKKKNLATLLASPVVIKGFQLKNGFGSDFGRDPSEG